MAIDIEPIKIKDERYNDKRTIIKTNKKPLIYCLIKFKRNIYVLPHFKFAGTAISNFFG